MYLNCANVPSITFHLISPVCKFQCNITYQGCQVIQFHIFLLEPQLSMWSVMFNSLLLKFSSLLLKQSCFVLLSGGVIFSLFIDPDHSVMFSNKVMYIFH